MAFDPWYPVPEAASRGRGFRSAFGGTWPDLDDAPRWLEGLQAIGVLDDDDVERFRFWIEHGYVRIDGAASADRVAALNATIEELWAGTGDHDPVFAETFDGALRIEPLTAALREREHKVLDLHVALAEARRVCLAEPVLRFLRLLFLRPPMAFQSLYFTYGTRQPMHQDTAYVPVSSPLEFAGVWIALEDVEPGTGELQYFDGSHRIPEYRFEDKWRSQPPGDGDPEAPLRYVYEQSVALGCELLKFQPTAGDALIWHADLVHGGASEVRAGSTRRSLVTHFCPEDVVPSWMHDGVEHSGRLRDDESGVAYCGMSQASRVR